MDKVRIAHLSDLHCDGTEEWLDNFNYIIAFINEQQPHLLIITGDSVNNPFPKNYTMLKSALSDLKSELTSTHLLTVPGNHDYSFGGNRLFNINLMKFYFKKQLKHLIHPENSLDKMTASFLKKFNIALFPLDSNSCKFFFGFAQGRIDSPLECLSKMDEKFSKLAADNNIPYSTRKKIVILHHHPLPLPSSAFDEKIERYLVLRNAYQFLEAACMRKIDIILHGHKHVSSLAKFDLLGDIGTSIIVSSCASSGKLGAPNREIKLLEIKRSGSAIVESYKAFTDRSAFVKGGGHPSVVIYYGDIRKRKYNNFDFLPDKDSTPIEYIQNKTKIVKIRDDGCAEIYLSLTGIKWRPDIHSRLKILKETLRADMGRILGGCYEFGKCPLDKVIVHNHLQWVHPLLEEGQLLSSCDPDQFDKSFRPKNPILKEEEDCFKLYYPLLNGFTLTLREHRETYPLWPQDMPCQEIASISVNYPTYYLELVVRFPTGFLPQEKDVYVEAMYRDEPGGPPTMNLLYGKNSICDEETEFLYDKGAVRVRPELNELAVIVKYPQPNLVYSLRWNLPPDHRDIALSPRHMRGFEYLLAEFNKPRSTLVDSFYTGIASEFLRQDAKKNEALKLFLLAYDEKDKTLKVVKCPPEFADKPKYNLFVGRGPAGKAFRTRKAQYWEKGIVIYDRHRTCEVENVVKGLSPIRVLSLPLMYPRLIEKEWENVNSSDEQCLCPAFGVLSIVAIGEEVLKTFSQLTDKKQREEHLADIYRIVGVQLEKHFVPILPA